MSNPRPGPRNGNGGSSTDSVLALADKLGRLGMPAEEAAVYVHLQASGPSKAGRIADLLGTSRQKIYRTFELMAHHGYAKAGTSRPRLYSAVPPATLIQLLHGRLEALENEFDDVLTQTVPSLEALRGVRVEHPPQVHFTLLRGVEAVAEQAGHMCRNAQEGVRVILGAPSDRLLLKSIVKNETLAKVEAQLLLAKKATAASPLVPAKTRVIDHDSLATSFLVDDLECLVVVSPQDGRKGAEPALAYRTNAPGVVAVQKAAFERFWQVARPFRP